MKQSKRFNSSKKSLKTLRYTNAPIDIVAQGHLQTTSCNQLTSRFSFCNRLSCRPGGPVGGYSEARTWQP